MTKSEHLAAAIFGVPAAALAVVTLGYLAAGRPNEATATGTLALGVVTVAAVVVPAFRETDRRAAQARALRVEMLAHLTCMHEGITINAVGPLELEHTKRVLNLAPRIEVLDPAEQDKVGEVIEKAVARGIFPRNPGMPATPGGPDLKAAIVAAKLVLSKRLDR